MCALLSTKCRGAAIMTAIPSCLQVREHVKTALTPLSLKAQAILSGVQDILRPVKDVSWPSGLPENN